MVFRVSWELTFYYTNIQCDQGPETYPAQPAHVEHLDDTHELV